MFCPRLDAPIVLAHGLFGFVRIGYGPVTLTRYFRGIPEFLRASGNRVLTSRVHPTGGIARRARKLGERIETAFGDEPVHIIAHSMGGLDARVLLSDRAWRRRVLSLTMISTPHLGSCLADAARLRLPQVYRFLESLGLDHRAFHDLTRRSARALHRSLPPPDGVPCFNVPCLPCPDDICAPLQQSHQVVMAREGPNDGLVSFASASAFGTPFAVWPTDHFQQMGWTTLGPTDDPALHRILTLYGRIVENLVPYDLAGVGCANHEPESGALVGTESFV